MTVGQLKKRLDKYPDDRKVTRYGNFGFEDIYSVRTEKVYANFTTKTSIKDQKETVVVLN